MSRIEAVVDRVEEIRSRFVVAAGRGGGDEFDAVFRRALGSGASPQAVPVSPSTVGILGTAVVLRGMTDGTWVAALPEAGRRWAPAIEAAAREAGIDPRLLAALVWTESSFRPDAESSAGAVGLTQLMPATAVELGVDPRDPLENLRGGARYLAQQLREFGTVELAAAAYNAGPGAVRDDPSPYLDDPGGYVDRLVARYRLLGGNHP